MKKNSRAAITKIYVVLLAIVLVMGGSMAWMYYLLTSPEESETIKIGVPLPLTGSMALEAITMSDGALLAQDEINARGGVLGKKIELVFGDTEGKAEIGSTVIERLILHDNVVAIAGFLHSSVAVAAMEISHKYDIPAVIVCANADSITELHSESGYDEVFRVIANTTCWGEAYAQFMVEALECESYAILGEEQEYSKLIGDTITEWFETNHPEIPKVAHVVVKWGERDYYPSWTEIKAAKPDVVYADPTGVAIALVAKTRWELGVPCMLVGWGVIRYAEDFIGLAGEEASENYCFGPWWSWTEALLAENNRAKLFYDMFRAKHNNEPSEYSAHQYNAIHVIFEAIKRAGSTDSDKLTEALAETDWMGTKGRITFASTTGQNPNDPVLFQQIQNGTNVAVWPFELADKPVSFPPY